jgi:hypothetical protein
VPNSQNAIAALAGRMNRTVNVQERQTSFFDEDDEDAAYFRDFDILFILANE